jgi:hypothetical protein
MSRNKVIALLPVLCYFQPPFKFYGSCLSLFQFSGNTDLLRFYCQYGNLNHLQLSSDRQAVPGRSEKLGQDFFKGRR